MASGISPILLVEDDDVLAGLLVEILGGLGEVVWSASAEEAEGRLGSRQWDLIVADVELPGRTGIEVVERVRALHPLCSTLIISGRSSFDYAVGAIRAGADDYLTKPLDPTAFFEKARELLERTRARRERGRVSVLAVGAHPDDPEIGVGGILLKHAAHGHSVALLTLTGGEQGGRQAQRAEESRRAAELLGARLFHQELVDTSLTDGGETISAIKEVIDEVAATAVYTHTPRDVHQDHRNTHHASLVAARGVPRVYCYQSPSTTVEFRPTRFVGIDDVLERKLEVIRAYGSQVQIRRYLDEELLRATARYWSRWSRSRFAEPLEVVRESDSGNGDG
ncbi:MAG: PIG-L family deacetylase [Solirubrobacterales bacterium]|nr:PIG-L family deacetylase [Solirubrobacterales bacterium]MBV9715547.1 PIG-L family deacetylase [Solirubrobacterales bacterium]